MKGRMSGRRGLRYDIAIHSGLNRWTVNVSTRNAHIYVLTEFNYVQRDIIRYIWSRMLTKMQEIKLINRCTNVVLPLCVALLHFDELI